MVYQNYISFHPQIHVGIADRDGTKAGTGVGTNAGTGVGTNAGTGMGTSPVTPKTTTSPMATARPNSTHPMVASTRCVQGTLYINIILYSYIHTHTHMHTHTTSLQQY